MNVKQIAGANEKFLKKSFSFFRLFGLWVLCFWYSQSALIMVRHDRTYSESLFSIFSLFIHLNKTTQSRNDDFFKQGSCIGKLTDLLFCLSFVEERDSFWIERTLALWVLSLSQKNYVILFEQSIMYNMNNDLYERCCEVPLFRGN